MTLLHQLYATVSAFLLALLIGSVVVSDTTNRIERAEQLQRNVQRVATALQGRTLVWEADGAEVADAFIGNGLYRRITITAPDGSVLVRRERPVVSVDVPAWFVRLHNSAPLQHPLVIDDRPVGTVEAVIDSGRVAANAWRRSLMLLGWLAALLVLAIGLIHYLVGRSLRPLRLVVAQANALSQRDYPIVAALPATPELRDVTVALNRVSTTLRKMVDTQMQAMNRLRDDAYRDHVTGLPNRRFLDLHLQQLIDATDEVHGGALLLLTLRLPPAQDTRLARVAHAALLVQTAAMIKAALLADAGPDYFVARYADGGFAISVSPATERETMALSVRLLAGLQQLRVSEPADDDVWQEAASNDDASGANEVSQISHIGHIGIALYRHQSAAQWLAEAESALRIAQARGPNSQQLHLSTIDAMAEKSVGRLADFLRSVIEQKNIILHLQPVLACGNALTLLQYEVLLRAVGDDGQLIAAAYFVPMAKRLGLMQQIDRLVVTEVVTRLQQKRYGDIRVAVNLSPTSMQDVGFINWLLATLRDNPIAAHRIAFEVSEIGVLEQLDTLTPLVDKVRQLGAQFGIDRVGRGFSSFDYLSSLPLDYLKIDGSFVRGIQLLGDNRDNQLLLDSICKVAHGLDVIVIAEAVETDEEWQCLRGLQLDGVQGYGVGMPAEI